MPCSLVKKVVLFLSYGQRFHWDIKFFGPRGHKRPRGQGPSIVCELWGHCGSFDTSTIPMRSLVLEILQVITVMYIRYFLLWFYSISRYSKGQKSNFLSIVLVNYCFLCSVYSTRCSIRSELMILTQAFFFGIFSKTQLEKKTQKNWKFRLISKKTPFKKPIVSLKLEFLAIFFP